MKHNYEFVNFKLLMLSLFVFAGIITGIRVAFETNSEMQIKIFISWFFVKTLIILANVNYIKNPFINFLIMAIAVSAKLRCYAIHI